MNKSTYIARHRALCRRMADLQGLDMLYALADSDQDMVHGVVEGSLALVVLDVGADKVRPVFVPSLPASHPLLAVAEEEPVARKKKD